MKPRILPFLAALLSPSLLPAAEAVFTADGGRIFYCSIEPGRLGIVDVAGKKLELLPVKAAGEDTITGLTRSSSGNIVMAAGKSIWAMNPDKKEAVKVCSAPDDKTEFIDISCNPKSGDFIITARRGASETTAGEHVTFVLKKGEKTVKELFVRRVERLGAAGFDAEGRFYFGDPYDLWAGDVMSLGDEEEMASGGVLNGYRYAPLATFQTNQGNGGPEITEAIAPAASGVYVAVVSRYGGKVLKLAHAPQAAEDSDEYLYEDVEKRIKVNIAALQSAKVLGECADRRSLLCVKPDGSAVCFLTTNADSGDRQILMLKNDREAEVVVPMPRDSM